MSEPRLFDPDSLRLRTRRAVFVRRVEHPTLVLGSTQPSQVVDSEAAEQLGVEVVRRRSGGGAVLLEPDRGIWVDTWVPRSDSLFDDDVARSRAWVGSWWARSLGPGPLAVHEGRPVATRFSHLVCFAGRASGEVTYDGRKVVGVAQWRSREGALTHSLAYLSVEWATLATLLGLGEDAAEAVAELKRSTATVGDVAGVDGSALTTRLLENLPGDATWDIESS